MALSQYALCALAEVKDYIGIAETSGDGQLVFIINKVSLVCQNTYLKRTLLSSEQVEYYDGNKTKRIILKRWPVTAVGEIIPWEDATAMDPDDYTIDGAAGIIHSKYIEFPKTVLEVKVTYTAGYVAGSDGVAAIPEDLRMSVIEAVAYRKRQRDRRSIGLRAQSRGDNAAEYDMAAWPASIKEVWNRYKWKGIG